MTEFLHPEEEKGKDLEPESAAELRERAEARWEDLRDQSTDEINLTFEGSRKLLHELQVHQIELEMQNDELRRIHIKAEESKARYVELYDFAPVGYCTVSETGLILQANLALATILGVPRGELLQQPFSRLIDRQDQDIFYQLRAGLLQEKLQDEIHECELRMLQFNEEKIHAHLAASLRQVKDHTKSLQLVISDITIRKQAEVKLQLAARVFRHAREGIIITDAQSNIINVNQAFTRITGYTLDEAVGQNPRLLSSGLQNREYYENLWKELRDKGYWSGEIWNLRKNKEMYAGLLSISAIRDEQGNTQQYLGLFTDITELKEHQNILDRMAHYDALTSLPNRLLLSDRLHQGLAQAQRSNQKLAVVYLDLDGFKSINDTFGHAAGDQVLITVAQRMQKELREGDTLARLGGDEFVAVLMGLVNNNGSLPLLSRLLAVAALPVLVDGVKLQVSASLGVTFYPQAQYIYIGADQLLRQADQAMYQAKVSGKNRYQIFDAKQDRNLRDYHESLQRIELALENKEFELYYQPKVNMRLGTVIGVEALIRWQHPQQGLLAPAQFLPVIEEHPLALAVGEWVINTALAQMEVWHDSGLDLPVSINIGAQQLQHPDFVQKLKATVARHPDLQPGYLELEVLETSALQDIVQVSTVINECAQFGVFFALDDFGTGYSSLNYLKRLRVSQLKIDRSFVLGMLENTDDLAILEGVIGLSSAFDLGTIAEGVETQKHGEMLLQIGCELAQGYFIARPMPAAQLQGWTESWQAPADWIACNRIRREDLPLLYAMVEHRSWVNSLKLHFEGLQDKPPPMNQHQCRFGKLLKNMNLRDSDSAHRFSKIELLHRQVHELAAELSEFYASGQTAKVVRRMHELYSLRDQLIAQLKILVMQNSTDRKKADRAES